MSKDAAKLLFSKGLNCAQSVLAAKSDITGISLSDSLKLATGFGAGMAMMQKSCGAVTGAYMVIGALHGSISCRELLGVDLKTEEGREEAESQGYFDNKCAAYVEDAERILNDIL